MIECPLEYNLLALLRACSASVTSFCHELAQECFCLDTERHSKIALTLYFSSKVLRDLFTVEEAAVVLSEMPSFESTALALALTVLVPCNVAKNCVNHLPRSRGMDDFVPLLHCSCRGESKSQKLNRRSTPKRKHRNASDFPCAVLQMPNTGEYWRPCFDICTIYHLNVPVICKCKNRRPLAWSIHSPTQETLIHHLHQNHLETFLIMFLRQAWGSTSTDLVPLVECAGFVHGLRSQYVTTSKHGGDDALRLVIFSHCLQSTYKVDGEFAEGLCAWYMRAC
jgi:hypothetical protein